MKKFLDNFVKKFNSSTDSEIIYYFRDGILHAELNGDAFYTGSEGLNESKQIEMMVEMLMSKGIFNEF